MASDEQTGAIIGAPNITLVDVASQTVRIEPGDEFVFFAEVVSNIDYNTSETIQWLFGDTIITARSDNIPAGSTHTFQSFLQSWSEVTNLVDPGVYTLTGVLAKSDVVGEVQTLQWKDSDENPIQVEVTDSSGELPGQADINITNVDRSPSTPTAGSTMDVSVTAENLGTDSGSKQYSLDMGLVGEPAQTVTNVDFSLSAGQGQTQTVTVQIPEDWAGQEAALSIGPISQNFDVALPQADVSLTSFNVNASVNTIDVSSTWSNNTSYDTSMDHVMEVTDETGTVVTTDSQFITIGPGGSTTVEATVQTDVPSDTQEDFEVCVRSENASTY